MKRIFIAILANLALFESCRSRSNYDKLSKISCDSAMHLLILSSNASNSLKNKLTIQDGLQHDTLLIKVYHENEAEPGAIFDAADGFLLMDITNRKLLEARIEDETLHELKCDKIILNHYIDSCIDYENN